MEDSLKLQKVLVDSANRKIQETLQQYCKKVYHSDQYYLYMKENLDTNVIEIPNPQIWVSKDSYLTNSTVFSMLNIAKEPYTYCQQLCKYEIPVDEPNFGEGELGEVKDFIFYHRYLAECIKVFNELNSFYPTHMVEVHDFSYMLYTLWVKTNMSLLRKVPEHYKHFFTRGMINQFLTSLTSLKVEENPNIKFIMYDPIGLATQCAQIKYNCFKSRFNCEFSPIAGFTDRDYRAFMKDIINPLRSVKALQKDFKYWNIEFREVTEFNEKIYHDLQGLFEGQRGSLNKILYTAFTELVNGSPIETVLEILKDVVEDSTYNSICRYLEEYRNTEFTYKYEFNPRALENMKKRSIAFTQYEYSLNLLPPYKVFSEVIINMDEFRKQYPSCTEQLFSEVYLMAQAINSCRRTFVKKYKREDWGLCVKIISGEKPFEFTKLVEDLTTKLCSEQMDNFTVRIV